MVPLERVAIARGPNCGDHAAYTSSVEIIPSTAFIENHSIRNA